MLPYKCIAAILEVLNEQCSIIARGRTNETPTVTQKNAMVHILQALGFYSEKFEKFSTMYAVINEEVKKREETTTNNILETIKQSLLT